MLMICNECDTVFDDSDPGVEIQEDRNGEMVTLCPECHSDDTEEPQNG